MPFKDNDPTHDNASPDEPLFTLRAQDKVAPVVVSIYGMICALIGSPREHVMSAHQIAKDMLAWQCDHRARVKVPD